MMDKFEKVQAGLKAMERMCSSCANCPYNTEKQCESTLAIDAIEVIGVLQKALKKRTDKTATSSKFLVLTPHRSDTEYEKKLGIKIDDILYIYNQGDNGSTITLKGHDDKIFFVHETLEEILGMIAKGD